VTWVDYLFIYVVVTIAVTTTLLLFRAIDMNIRYQKAKKLIEEISETIESEMKFKDIVSKLDMDGDK
jgi:hypothetical protein